MSLLAVAVPGVGATSQVADAEERADASDLCYVWIDGNTYCCEWTSHGLRCEVPRESAEAESIAPADEVSTASNGCVGNKDLAAVCVCTQTYEPLYEVWINGKQVAEGPICI